MNMRVGRKIAFLLVFMNHCALDVTAQVTPDPLSPSNRPKFPFAFEPDRLPGPPRVMGELPQGSFQPPTTLPGRVFDQPPRAMGEAPTAPSYIPRTFVPAPPQTPSSPPGDTSIFIPGVLRPSVPTGSAPTSYSSDSLFLPWLRSSPRSGTGLPNSELPPALLRDRAGSSTEGGENESLPAVTLEQVLQSTEKTSPQLQAILLERKIASGELLSASGAFDLNINSDSRNYPLGYYNRSVQDVFVEQPLQWNGAKVFAGYRIAQGNFPTYYNYLNTRSGGAFVAGFELPLLKNREIDAKRAKLYQAEIERSKAEPTVLKQRISLFKDAAKAYWYWVAACQTAAVYRDLIRDAESRKQALENQAREGIIRAIDLVDFRRILLSRQQQLIAAERRVQQTTFELSLYLRDSYGLPILAEPTRAPLSYPIQPAPDPKQLTDGVEIALRLRPEILSLRLQARKVEIDAAYARNQLKPSLNLYIYTEQNAGNRAVDLVTDFRPFIMETSLLFDVPLQRRQARGRVRTAEASLEQILIQTRYASDRIRADVLDASSALITAYDQLVRYRENEAINLRLEDAERTLVLEGSSSELFLNLREQATSDARVTRLEAEAKFQAGLAEYRAAIGVDTAF